MSTAHRERGRVNAHTHIYSGLAPLGMPAAEPPPTNFLEILERVWWRLDRALDEASLRAAARFYVADALLHGTSTLIDHHESPEFIDGSLDVIADACHELGMRAVLCFGATERNGGREEARRGLEECRRFITQNDRPRVRGLVGLHASFTVSDETIREAADLCGRLGSVLHVHLAEDACDVTDARERGYDGPLERLLALGALPPGSILAHGVHLSADQVRLAADAGVWLVQNPRSNHGNGVGYPGALHVSDRVALGTDGYPSDLHAEASALTEHAAAAGDRSDTLSPRIYAGQRLVSALFGRAASSGDEGDARDEDVPAVPSDEASFVEATDPRVELSPGRVRDLWIDDRDVVVNGRLVTGDVDAIRSDATAQATRLWQRMQAR